MASNSKLFDFSGDATIVSSFDSSNIASGDSISIVTNGFHVGSAIDFNITSASADTSIRKNFSNLSARIAEGKWMVPSATTLTGGQCLMHIWQDNGGTGYGADLIELRIVNVTGGFKLRLTDPANGYVNSDGTTVIKKDQPFRASVVMTDTGFKVYLEANTNTAEISYTITNTSKNYGVIGWTGNFYNGLLSGHLYLDDVRVYTLKGTAPSTNDTKNLEAFNDWLLMQHTSKSTDGTNTLIVPFRMFAEGNWDTTGTPNYQGGTSVDTTSETMHYALEAALRINDQTSFDQLYWFWKNKFRRYNFTLTSQILDGKAVPTNLYNLMGWHMRTSDFKAYDIDPAPDGDEGVADAFIDAYDKFRSGVWTNTGIDYKQAALDIATDLLAISVTYVNGGTTYRYIVGTDQLSNTSVALNASYFMPKLYRKLYVLTSDVKWNQMIDGAYDHLSKITATTGTLATSVRLPTNNSNQNISTGAVGSPVYGDINFTYDAPRVNYYIEEDYEFSNDSRALLYLNNVYTYFYSGKTTIYAEYNHDGTLHGTGCESVFHYILAHVVLKRNSASNTATVYAKATNSFIRNESGSGYSNDPNTASNGTPSYYGGYWTGKVIAYQESGYPVNQYILGLSRITKVTSKTLSGLSRISLISFKTLLGKGNIKANSLQTILARARIGILTLQTLLAKSRIGLVTAKTILSKSRITLITLQTTLGKSRIALLTTKTIQGLSRITKITTQTILGKANIIKNTLQNLSGKSRITIQTIQIILGKSRIQISNVKNILGVSRIGLISLRTVLGKSRIALVTIQTILGKSRITVTSLRTIQGVAKINSITITTVQTLLGKANIKANTTQSLLATSRIQLIRITLILGKARIALVALKTIIAVSRVALISSKSLLGLSRIAFITTKTIQGIGRIGYINSRIIQGISRIGRITTQNILGKSDVLTLTLKSLTGLARIQYITNKVILGVSRIALVSSKTLQGISRITLIQSRIILGISRISYVTLVTILGKSRIAIISTKSISGFAKINANRIINIQGLGRIQIVTFQNFLGKSRIGLVSIKTIQALARISLVTIQTIVAKARISIQSLKNINGISNIRTNTPQNIFGMARIASKIEYRIENNVIVDPNRTDWIGAIFTSLNGLTFYPFEADTIGLGYYEIGDRITVKDLSNNPFDVVVLSYEINIDGGMSETLTADVPIATHTNYAYAGIIGQAIKNTQIIVDKQKQLISLINQNISTNYYTKTDTIAQINIGTNSIQQSVSTALFQTQANAAAITTIQTNVTNLQQTSNSLSLQVQGTGGINLIKNSAGLKTDIKDWQLLDTNGALIDSRNMATIDQSTTTQQNTESGSAFSLTNQYILQTFNTIIGKSYTIYLRYQSTSNAMLTITGVTGVITLPTVASYTTFKYTYIPTTSSTTLKLESTSSITLLASDIVVKIGDTNGWIQAPNEVYGKNFLFDKNGFSITSLTDPFKSVLDNTKLAVYDTSSGTNKTILLVSKDSGKITQLIVQDQLVVRRYENPASSMRMIPTDTGVLLVIND